MSIRLGFKYLLVLSTVVATILAVVLWFRSVDWDYSLLVSLNCRNGRQIDIYVDSFCDRATIPVYDVTIDGKIVKKKYSTDLWFVCGDPIRKQDFATTWDDTNTLVAVTYKDRLALVYDFEKEQGWPNANGGYDVSNLDLKRIKLPHAIGNE